MLEGNSRLASRIQLAAQELVVCCVMMSLIGVDVMSGVFKSNNE